VTCIPGLARLLADTTLDRDLGFSRFAFPWVDGGGWMIADVIWYTVLYWSVPCCDWLCQRSQENKISRAK